jgi:hypothetical protein
MGADNGKESSERPACAEAAQASSGPRMARLIWNSAFDVAQAMSLVEWETRERKQ